MIDTTTIKRQHANVDRQEWRKETAWKLWFLFIVAVTGLTGFFVLFIMPIPLPMAGIVFLVTVATIFYRPRLGIYFVLFFSLLGDSALWPWYPFVKNLSSRESILYLHNALIFSPLEFYLLLIVVAWLGKQAMQRRFNFYSGILFWPAIAFTVCLVFGLAYGIGTGGNANIALWEARPIFYLPLMLILTSNLFTERAHISQLMWVVMFAIFVEGIVGTQFYLVKLGGDLTGIDAITEHSAAIQMNVLYMFTIAVFLYSGSITKRMVMPPLLPVVALAYLATQRRAAYLSLGIAMIFVFTSLYRRRRRAFWFITPITLVLLLAYLAMFWNSSGALAMPASAVRSIIAPDVTGKDYLSNLYRQIENANTNFTIHQAPLTGVGFGQKFYILVPMPDISFFSWWEYIVHNSILWIWVKTGVFGFVAMIFLVGLSIVTGVRALLRMPDGDLSAALLVATLYIVMHFLYAYVDMSWDTQSMLLVGAMMGIINCAEHIVAKPVRLLPKRWPWQPDPMPPPGLAPRY